MDAIYTVLAKLIINVENIVGSGVKGGLKKEIESGTKLVIDRSMNKIYLKIKSKLNLNSFKRKFGKLDPDNPDLVKELSKTIEEVYYSDREFRELVKEILSDREVKIWLFEESTKRQIMDSEDLKYIPDLFGFGGSGGLPIEDFYVELSVSRKYFKDNISKPEEQNEKTEETKTPDEVIEESVKNNRNRIIIFGVPGSGKTTLAKYYAVKLNREGKFRVVFYRKLRNYDGGDLKTFVFGKADSDILDTIFVLRKTFDYLIILDGFDEVNPEYKQRLSEEINKFPFFTVVTSRPISTYIKTDERQIYEILPLKEKIAIKMAEKDRLLFEERWDESGHRKV